MSIRTWSGVQYNAVGRKLKQIIDHYPGNQSNYYVTSSHRSHTPRSHHGGRLSYGGSPTSAVDIGFNYNGSASSTARGRAFAEWLLRFQSNTVELIHTFGPTGSNGIYVKNTNRVGPYSVDLHRNHIHFACSSAQADRILRSLRNSGGGSSTPSPPPRPPRDSIMPPADGW